VAERIAVLCRERERVQQMLPPSEDGFIEAAGCEELREATPERRTELTARIAEYDRLIARWSVDLDGLEPGQAI
jgi:hypothetical protein